MKSIIFLALILSAAIAKTSLMNHEGKYPLVEGLGYKDRILPIPGVNFGFGAKLQGDFYIGYKTDLFYLDSTTNYIVANPSIFLEVGLKTQIDFIMPFFE